MASHHYSVAYAEPGTGGPAIICLLNVHPQYKVILGPENAAHWSPVPTSL